MIMDMYNAALDWLSTPSGHLFGPVVLDFFTGSYGTGLVNKCRLIGSIMESQKSAVTSWMLKQNQQLNKVTGYRDERYLFEPTVDRDL
jgi:hypothetical protein